MVSGKPRRYYAATVKKADSKIVFGSRVVLVIPWLSIWFSALNTIYDYFDDIGMERAISVGNENTQHSRRAVSAERIEENEMRSDSKTARRKKGNRNPPQNPPHG